MQIIYPPAGGAVGAAEFEVSRVTLYTKQSTGHKHCFIRHYMQDEMKMTSKFFHQKYSDIKTPARVSILKRAVLNQAFSPPPNHSKFRRRELQFVMSQIQENYFVVQTSRSL